MDLSSPSEPGAGPMMPDPPRTAPAPVRNGTSNLLEPGATLPFQVVESASPPAHPAGSLEGSLVVLRCGVPDDVYVAGTVLHTRGDLTPAVVAAIWRDRLLRMSERSRMPERLIAFFRELHGADDEEMVCRAVAGHVVRILGGRRAWLVLSDGPTPVCEGGVPAFNGSATGTDLDRESHGTSAPSALAHPGLISPIDLAEALGDYVSQCEDLLEDRSLALVAHTPIGTRGWLLLGEDRSDRVFWPDDWDILSAIGEQAEQALLRIRLLENTRKLSLTDPLTGLANRRQMDLVLRHAWSAAERGEGLALLMLDLDGFKELNDTRGHAYGDRMLCLAADVIRGEARGSDVVIRYGGDEFLVVLPRATARGAQALATRIRQRLAGTLSVSEGIASYRPTFASSEDLLKVADLNLYGSKHRRTTRRSELPPQP
jgi:diguanylate cyclase (GGDEF)-like protein